MTINVCNVARPLRWHTVVIALTCGWLDQRVVRARQPSTLCLLVAPATQCRLLLQNGRRSACCGAVCEHRSSFPCYWGAASFACRSQSFLHEAHWPLRVDQLRHYASGARLPRTMRSPSKGLQNLLLVAHHLRFVWHWLSEGCDLRVQCDSQSPLSSYTFAKRWRRPVHDVCT
jgi:hypothetical protein